MNVSMKHMTVMPMLLAQTLMPHGNAIAMVVIWATVLPSVTISTNVHLSTFLMIVTPMPSVLIPMEVMNVHIDWWY